ncbi:hypothetical protein H0H92_003134 [Tricholoma furcatifolium]|nr:hypothetical protein H0H92_003134 [Tricholoma furcatifolium]
MFAWTPRSEDLIGSGSAYPSPDAYKAFSNTNYVDPPKKKVDAIAEAWGIHEPEPYEEFFAGGGTGRADGDTPASSIYNGRDSHRPSAQRRAKDANIDQSISADPARRPIKRTLPPPQPIFVDDKSDLADTSGTSPPLSPGGNTQRKKSLMHRIRKMRDAPNVPVSSSDYDTPPSPSSVSDSHGTRPTHRSQNSFLGRFGGRTSQSAPDKPEPFIYIEQSNKDVNKELPPPPIGGGGESPPDGTYLDNNAGGAAIGRKTSLMKKVGRVVGRNRQ